MNKLRCYSVMMVNRKPKCFNCVAVKEFNYPNDTDFKIDFTKSLPAIRNQWRRLIASWKDAKGRHLPTRTIAIGVEPSRPIHYNLYKLGLPKGLAYVHNPAKRGGYLSEFPGYDEQGKRLDVATYGYIDRMEKE